jgi:hypothetical protein
MSTDPKFTQTLVQKKNVYQNIRQDIKKKRVVFDENQDRFGLDEMSQLSKVKNTSEVKGYPFKVSSTKFKTAQLAIKVVPIETKYDKHEHPCNLENLVLKELTDNVVNTGISPHIVYYIGTQKIPNKCRALKPLNLKRLEVEDKVRTHSNMLISEFVSGGSLDNWIFNIYENDKEITDTEWRCIVFQLIYTIAVMQNKYKMMHNDFHYGNILIDDTLTPGGYFVYETKENVYYLPNTGKIPKVWDYEFVMVYSDKIRDCYPNKYIIGPHTYDKKTHTTIVRDDDSLSTNSREFNVPYNYNEVYDLHYFLTSLLDLYISQELFDWIMSLYPQELIPEEEVSSLSQSKGSDHDSDTISSSSLNSSESQTSSDESDSDETKSESSGESSGESSSESSGESTSSESESDDSASDEISYTQRYLNEGRMINGIEDQFDLPKPIDILKHSFFDVFTRKPEDFDPLTAIYCKAGF